MRLIYFYLMGLGERETTSHRQPYIRIQKVRQDEDERQREREKEEARVEVRGKG